MIFVLDAKNTVVGVLSNDAPNACPYFDDKHVENIETGEHSYDFSVPATHDMAENLVAESSVIIKDLDGYMHQFTIKNVVESSTRSGYVKHVKTEHIAISELLTYVIRPFRMDSATVETSLSHVLQGTGYSIGDIDFIGSRDIVVDDFMTALEAVYFIAKEFDAEIQFETIFRHGTIHHKLIHVTEQRGTVTNTLFTYSKDIDDVEREEDSTNLVTALIGIGKGDVDGERVTLTDISGSSLPDGYSKERNLDYVSNDEAFQRFNINGRHRMGVYKDDSEHATVLLENTVEKLKELSKPRLTYKCTIPTLERITGYEAKKVRIGDTILIQDFSFRPALLVEARVLELVRSYINPEEDELILGDFRTLDIATYSVIDRLQEIISRNQNRWDSGMLEDEVIIIVDDKVKPVDDKATDAQDKAEDALNQSKESLESIEDIRASFDGFLVEIQDTIDKADITKEVADAIKMDVDDAVKDITSLYDVVGDFETKIEKHEDRITHMVTSEDITGNNLVSIINQDSTSISLLAKRINLAGAVTVLSDITGSLGTITAGTIQGVTITASDFYGGTFTGNTFYSGEMHNAELYSGYIYGTEIEGGTIRGNVITGGSIDGASIISEHPSTPIRMEMRNGSIRTIHSSTLESTTISAHGFDVESDYWGEGLYRATAIHLRRDGRSFDIDLASNQARINYFTGNNNYNNYLTLEMNATFRFNGDASFNRELYFGTNPIQSVAEVGFCGIGAVNPHRLRATPLAGVGVNFRTKKRYAPSSVSLSGVSHNLRTSTLIEAIGITRDGFWLHMLGDSDTVNYRYWRGTYTA